MNLASNHYFLTVGPDVNEIIKPLNFLGITYFSYMKSDQNGGRIYLYNNTEVLDSYLKKNYYINGNKECDPLNYKEQVYLWSTLPNQYEYDENVRARGIDHGISIFKPNNTSLEVFAFATKANNHNILNTYITQIEYLQKFTNYFREKATSLIKLAEINKIILPFNNKFNFPSNENIPHEYAFTKQKINTLSNRQHECCELIMKGYTTKEIAANMGLSARTVEYYLNNVKVKLGCKNKTELLVKLISMQ